MYNFARPKDAAAATRPQWVDLVAKYQHPNMRRSLWQLAHTFSLYVLAWVLLYFSLKLSYLLTLLLAIPTAGLLIRIFIILHDCGHGSFFKSNRLNDIVGAICGVFTFTPYLQWRHAHAIHHASSGDLDRRGVGDVLTLTVREYLSLSWWKRLGYRLYRHPVVIFGLGPIWVFLIAHRFVQKESGKREAFHVHWTNLAIVCVALLATLLMGFQNYVLIQLPITLLSSVAGVWMFYVQHQFEDTYWRDHPRWQYVDAALQGSSYFKLPKVLQWFSGNIGFHHIHHLSPKIPNYNLERCFKENPYFQQVTVITFWESFKTISLKLWDEHGKQLVSFGQLKLLKRQYAELGLL